MSKRSKKDVPELDRSVVAASANGSDFGGLSDHEASQNSGFIANMYEQISEYKKMVPDHPAYGVLKWHFKSLHSIVAGLNSDGGEVGHVILEELTHTVNKIIYEARSQKKRLTKKQEKERERTKKKVVDLGNGIQVFRDLVDKMCGLRQSIHVFEVSYFSD